MSMSRGRFSLALALLLIVGLAPSLPAVAGEEPAFDTPPRVAKMANPVFPARALEARAEGQVLLQLQVDIEGAIAGAEVVGEVQGWPEFGVAALATLPAWRFEPARLDGKPVPAKVLLPVSFRLETCGDEETD